MQKASYHTNIVIAHQMDLLPSCIQKPIPKSTLHDWKKRDLSKLVNFQDISSNIEDIQTLVHSKYWPKIQKLIAINRILRNAIKKSKGSKSILKSVRKSIIKCVTRYSDTITSKKRLLKWIGVSVQTYTYWLHHSRMCYSSLLELCRIKHPFQVTVKEIKVINKYLNKEQYKCWSLVSIYYKMLKDGSLFCGISTFYKYARLLGFSRSFGSHKNRTEGIRAKRPGEILHADVTELKLADNTKIYIHVLMDNFSRKILKCIASLNKSAKITCDNVRTTIEEYPQIFKQKPMLMVDDGSENKGEVDQLLESRPELFKKVVAQIDIDFSNSMVEAINKIIKNQYIQGQKFFSLDALIKTLDSIVDDFNTERPNGQLYGLTPKNVFAGEIPEKNKFSRQIEDARLTRKATNQVFDCNTCSDKELQEDENQ